MKELKEGETYAINDLSGKNIGYAMLDGNTLWIYGLDNKPISWMTIE
ncbi:MAG: hypothetical protein WC554_13765 [Clostridia bacterium]|jgi:hypothetical protein